MQAQLGRGSAAAAPLRAYSVTISHPEGVETFRFLGTHAIDAVQRALDIVWDLWAWPPQVLRIKVEPANANREVTHERERV